MNTSGLDSRGGQENLVSSVSVLLVSLLLLVKYSMTAGSFFWSSVPDMVTVILRGG